MYICLLVLQLISPSVTACIEKPLCPDWFNKKTCFHDMMKEKCQKTCGLCNDTSTSTPNFNDQGTTTVTSLSDVTSAYTNSERQDPDTIKVTDARQTPVTLTFDDDVMVAETDDPEEAAGAEVIGVTGVVFVVIFLLILVVLDLPTFRKNVRQLKRNLQTMRTNSKRAPTKQDWATPAGKC